MAPQMESDATDSEGGPMHLTQTRVNLGTSLVRIEVRAFMVRALSEESGCLLNIGRVWEHSRQRR